MVVRAQVRVVKRPFTISLSLTDWVTIIFSSSITNCEGFVLFCVPLLLSIIHSL